MTMQHYPKRQYRKTPWKNGQGFTYEIAASPDSATASDAFEWRLSMAEVAASGPFSQFPGIDRIITQLSGPSMSLEHRNHSKTRLRLNEPYEFSGDWQTTATLSSPCTDLNLMTRRGKWTASAALVKQVDAIAESSVCNTIILFVLHGSLECAKNSQYARAEAGDTLLVELKKNQPPIWTADDQFAAIIFYLAEVTKLANSAAD